MAMQQLILMGLGLLLVSVAIVVGINMFHENASSANLDAVSNDVINLGSRAQVFYRKPGWLGGGSNSFETLTLQNLVQGLTEDTWTNQNGSYYVDGDATATEVWLIGSGVEKRNGKFFEVHCRVTADSLITSVEYVPEKRGPMGKAAPGQRGKKKGHVK